MKNILIVIGIIVLGILGYLYYTYIGTTEVIIDDKVVAVYPNTFIAKKNVKEIIDEKLNSKKDAEVNLNIQYKKSKEKPKGINTNKTNLEKNINIQIPCTIILVDNKPLIGLPTKDDAGMFMVQIKDKFKVEGCEEPEIKENVTIDNSSIDVDKYFSTPEEAIESIYNEENRLKKKEIKYKVKKGDTLSKIAKEYGTSISEIESLNTDVKLLKPGQELTIKAKVLSKPLITVITRKPQKGVVTVDPPVIKVSSKKIPYGKEKVISQGKSGKKRVEGYIIYENGEKVREENTFEEYIVQPQPKQIAVGI